MSRPSAESTHPPAKPLMVPRITPMTTVMIVAVIATRSEMRAPKSSIIAMSVPVPGSTPNGWDQLIPELRKPKGSPPVDMSSSSTWLLVGLSRKKLAIGGTHRHQQQDDHDRDQGEHPPLVPPEPRPGDGLERAASDHLGLVAVTQGFRVEDLVLDGAGNDRTGHTGPGTS